MSNYTTFGDISPRTAAYAVAQLLKRSLPYLVLEKFGQVYYLPNNVGGIAKFRRYYLSGSTGGAGDGDPTQPYNTQLSTTPLVEGVTPSGRKLLNKDYTATLQQYGDFVTITDVIMDTHEDRVLQQMTEILGESAAQTIETIRFNVLKAGSNVFYSNDDGTPLRTEVTATISIELQRKITTALTRQNAKKITSIVKSTPDFRMEPVEASYVALAHPDLETDIRKMTGFIPTKQYGTVTPWEGEIGAVEQVRYLQSTVFAPWINAGGDKGAMRSTGGTKADIYPVLYFGRDAFGIVVLKGKDALTPMVVNPKPAAGDPLAQRGTVGWKCYSATVILNDAWMARAEVCATL